MCDISQWDRTDSVWSPFRILSWTKFIAKIRLLKYTLPRCKKKKFTKHQHMLICVTTSTYFTEFYGKIYNVWRYCWKFTIWLHMINFPFAIPTIISKMHPQDQHSNYDQHKSANLAWPYNFNGTSDKNEGMLDTIVAFQQIK